VADITVTVSSPGLVPYGYDDFGEQIWGGLSPSATITTGGLTTLADASVSVTGISLIALTHPVDIKIDGNISVNVDEDDDIVIYTGNVTTSIGQNVSVNVDEDDDIVISQGQINFVFNSGWGSNEWGLYTWGISGDVAVVTGSQLNVANNLNSVIVTGTANQNVSGQQLNTNINGVTVTGTANLDVTGSRLNVEIGNENATADVSVSVTTAGRLNLSEGTVTAEGEVREGWGVYQWGAVPWGGEQDPEVNVIGSALEAVTHPVDIQIDGNISVSVDEDDDITIAVGSPSIRTDVAFNVTGSRLNITEGLNTVLIIINVNVPITGSQVNLNIGQVEAFQETPVPVTTAGRLNVLIGNESTTADANVPVTGSQLNGSLGQIKYIATYSVTGSQANLSTGTVTFVITGSTTVTGSRLNISEGSVNIQGWSEVQTGANNTWTPVDIAA
jgi:hypothetical protein